MAKLNQFDPPAFLNDLNEEQKNDWSKFISNNFDFMISLQEREVGNGKCQFYNPMKVDTPNEHITRPIIWKAFPKLLADKYEENMEQAYKEADEELIHDGEKIYRPQDEYCEWHVERDNQTGKIKRITFTCEGPEYWKFLANVNPDKVVNLYKTYVNQEVTKEELFPNGKYNPYNIWNTEKGKMHLTHRNNTLSAEINIAAAATIVRMDKDGNLIKAYDQLIECSGFGEGGRASDPLIGGTVNDFARDKDFITLRNPVGLYIGDLDTSSLKTKTGKDAKNYWKIVRGQDRGEVLGVRAVFEIPSDEEIYIGDKPIRFGGQIAKFIDIKLVGVVCRIGKAENEPHPCPKQNIGNVVPESAEINNTSVISDMITTSISRRL